MADFQTVQIHFNRGWKLLLLGLLQAESFSRYMAMAYISKALPSLNETLLDSLVRECLFKVLANLMMSDERPENRLKAVYLLGRLAFHLGNVKEHDDLLYSAFNDLCRELLAIQHQEKLMPKASQPEFQNHIIYSYLLVSVC